MRFFSYKYNYVRCIFCRLVYMVSMLQTDSLILQVDIFGRCSGAEFTSLSAIRSVIEPNYKFYLSFENSFCTDYITEKFFRYYNWDVVLVTRGGANYSALLPPDTFIDASQFKSAFELVQYLKEVLSSETRYLNFFNQKNKYFASETTDTVTLPYCSICEKLNNLQVNKKMYNDHVSYMHSDTCWSPADLRHYQIKPLSIIIFASWFIGLLFVSICCIFIKLK